MGLHLRIHKSTAEWLFRTTPQRPGKGPWYQYSADCYGCSLYSMTTFNNGVGNTTSMGLDGQCGVLYTAPASKQAFRLESVRSIFRAHRWYRKSSIKKRHMAAKTALLCHNGVGEWWAEKRIMGSTAPKEMVQGPLRPLARRRTSLTFSLTALYQY